MSIFYFLRVPPFLGRICCQAWTNKRHCKPKNLVCHVKKSCSGGVGFRLVIEEFIGNLYS